MSTVRDALIGAWKLCSFVFVRVEDGAETFPVGERPQGLIVYTATGQMSVHIQRRGRLVAHTDDWAEATPAEIDTAFKGYNGYAGSFAVDEERGVVVHSVELAWYQNWEGSQQTRFYELDGDLLTLSAGPRLLAGHMQTTRLVWERIH